MCKKIISVILLSVIFSTFAEAKYVRFAVNMKYSGMLNSNDAYMSSTFQTAIGMGGDLTHGYLHLTQSASDTNIYYATYNIPAFQMYEYQFELGIAGYDIENIPVESQSLANGYRWLYVDSLNNDTLMMPAVYYSGNNTATDTMYRFKVNMSNETVSANGVHIAGDFQGNNPSTLRMYSFGNGIYEYMAWLTPATMVHYKFYNGNTIANVEIIPTWCTMGGYRMITSVSNAQILPTVCFSSCSNCFPASTSNLDEINSIKLAPNPMSSNATLTFNDNATSHSVSILDMQGRIIKQLNNINTNSVQINNDMMSASCYFLQIVNDKNERTTMKLIVD
jgi:hypothetical protein